MSFIKELLKFKLYNSKLNKIKLKKAAKQNYPVTIEENYAKYLRKYVNALLLQTKKHFPELKKKLDEINLEKGIVTKNDDISDDLSYLIDEMQAEFDNIYDEEEINNEIRNIALLIALFNQKQTSKVLFSMTGINAFEPEPWLPIQMNLFVKNNVGLIKSISSRYFEQLEEVVFRNFSQGLRWENLRDDIQTLYGKTRNRATLIARDQTGKLNGQLTQIRQTSIGISEYIWRTSLDERVRPLHREFEGKRYKWVSGGPDGHPGEAIQCRCWAEPYLEKILADLI